MRCSILLAVSCAISAWAQPQPASQEEINRALEVLRNTAAVPPPPTAKPGVPIKITNTASNSAPSLAPGKPMVLPPPGSPLTTDMERRARELLDNTKAEPRTQSTSPAKEVLDRANAREELRKQAVEETRRGLPQTATTAQPGTLAEEQQRKAQEEIDRQKNIERIEMEVQRARLARQQKAASQVEAAKTNAPAPVVATTTNAPAKPAALTNAPAVAVTPPPAPRPAPAPTPVTPPPQVAAPAPVKPAPVTAAQPVPPAPEPKPVVVQQAPPPVVAPTPAPAPVSPPASVVQQPPPQVAPAFKGLAPDMEQRARDILNQVMSNTKGASLPELATQPPKPAPVVPPPQPQPEPQPTTAATTPVRGPDAPVVATKAPAPTPKTETSTPITPDQEAKARELLNQLLTKPAPAATPVPPPAPAVATKAPEVTQPAPVITPAPVVTKATPVPAPRPEAPAPMATDQEAKARALLNQTLATLPAPTPVPAPTPTPATASAVETKTKTMPEADRRAQEDARRQAKLKAEIEDQTRREIARMEEESQTRAREMAKRRLEEEKRGQRKPQTTEVAATPVVKPAVAVRSTPEPVEPKPPPAKPAEKPRRAKSDANSKAPANAPVQETWKSADKPREQRLSDLLEAYRKDQISAQQYHSERAKILAAPQ